MKKIAIVSEYITLAAFLKLCGECSTGGEAKMAVVGGEVLFG